MSNQRWLYLFLALVGCLLQPMPGYAQLRVREPVRRPYVQIPFDANLAERMLTKQFLEASQLEELRQLLAEIQRNPDLSRVMPQSMPKLDLNDPEVRARVQKLLDRPPGGLKFDPKTRQALQRALAKEAGQVDASPAVKRPGVRPAENAKPTQDQGQAPPNAPAPPPGARSVDEELLARWTRDFLKTAERWDLDDLAKDSPALREAMRDLQHYFADPERLTRGWNHKGLERWTTVLQPKGGWLRSLPDLSWARPDNLALPSVPRPNVGLPRLGSWGGVRAVGGIGLPRLRGPAGGFALGQGLLWVAVVAVAGLALWQVLRRSGAGVPRGAQAPWKPGPWPVDPAHVATAAQLIQAFEYLSLLHLGQGARSQNHRAIAAHLGGDGEQDSQRRQAADELASLYEQARYAPAAETLSAAALACARRDLCFFAGVATT
jgi:hypothetical protein